MQSEDWYFWNQLPNIVKGLDSIADEHKRFELINKIKLALETEKQKEAEVTLERLRELNALKFVKVNEELMNNLKECMANYLDSRFLSTIALCGIIAEEIVLDTFQRLEIKINGNILDSKQAFNTFKYLTQENRISILNSMQIIKPEVRGKLDQIRIKRNNYLHPSKSDNKQKDALDSINLLMNIIEELYIAKNIPFDIFLSIINKK